MAKFTLEGIEAVCRYFGGVQALADKLGISRQAIYQWDGVIPPERAIQIEEESGGHYTRWDLRPDHFGPKQTEAA